MDEKILATLVVIQNDLLKIHEDIASIHEDIANVNTRIDILEMKLKDEIQDTKTELKAYVDKTRDQIETELKAYVDKTRDQIENELKAYVDKTRKEMTLELEDFIMDTFDSQIAEQINDHERRIYALETEVFGSGSVSVREPKSEVYGAGIKQKAKRD